MSRRSKYTQPTQPQGWKSLVNLRLLPDNALKSQTLTRRSYVLQVLALLGLIWGVANAAYVQLYPQKNQTVQQHGDNRVTGQEEVLAHRGLIVDRKDQLLASNLSKASVSLVGSQAKLTIEHKEKLAEILNISLQDLESKITQAKLGFVYLKRNLDVEQGRAVRDMIRALKITGVYVNDDFYRYYPQGESAAQLIGTVNLSGQAIDGLEASLNEQLEGVNGTRRYIKSGVGNVVESLDNTDPPIHGSDVQLTIDKDLQYSVYTELRAAVLANEAKAGSAVMLNATTGEILALANYPSFDPNKSGGKSAERMRNRAATDAFEPGSTLKPFTMSLALQKGLVTHDTVFSGEPFMVGKLKVSDGPHSHARLNLAQVMQYSSNVGTVKMVRQLSNTEFHAWLSAVGIGQPVRLPFGSATLGRLRSPERWQEVEKATMSYGYGLSVSVLQLARAYTVFTNQGQVLPLSLIKTNNLVQGTPVMRPEVAAILRDYMERVTEKEGTAPCASVDNFRTAGKTGTARKFNGKQYLEKYVASFVGFAPASAPKVIVAVMIDEPGLKGKYYGGVVAAPVFANVVANTMRVMNVAPDGGPKAACSFELTQEVL